MAYYQCGNSKKKITISAWSSKGWDNGDFTTTYVTVNGNYVIYKHKDYYSRPATVEIEV